MTAEPHAPASGPSGVRCTPLIAVDDLPPMGVVRLPSSSRSAVERALVDGHERAVESATARLSALVEPLSGLIAAEVTSSPMACRVDRPALDALGLASIVDHLVVAHDLPASRLRAADHTGPLEAAAALDIGATVFGLSRPETGRIAELVQRGGTVTWPGIDQCAPSLSPLLEDWDRVVGATCRLDASWVGSDAVAPPAGRHSAAGRAAGHLLWAVDGNATVHPSPPGGGAATGAFTTSSATDQAVWLPPSWSHRSVAGKPTLVATLVIPRVTAHDFAALVGREAVLWPLIRADLPFAPGAAHRSYGGSLFDRPDAFADATSALADDASLDRALARLRVALPGRPTQRFSSVVAAVGGGDRLPGSASVRCPLPGGIVVAEDAPSGSASHDDTVLLAAAGKRLRLLAHAARVLAGWSDGDRHRVDSAIGCPDGDASCAGRLATGLVRAGILELVG